MDDKPSRATEAHGEAAGLVKMQFPLHNNDTCIVNKKCSTFSFWFGYWLIHGTQAAASFYR